MAQRVNYSTNPRSYAQLLSSGVSPAQIREAINSGLNPSQLPPEYFGMSGGYTPQSVGGGAPQGIGGIDIPPASMGDPYAYTPSGGPGSTGAFGTTPNFGFPSSFDFGGVPSASTSYLGIPGAASSSGSMSPMGGNPMGFSGGITPDWWNLPSSNQYGWTAPDYGSNYGYDPSSYGFMSSPASLSYSEPTPIEFSDPVSMGSMGPPTGLFDPFQVAPSDTFEPLPTDYSSLGIPGSADPQTVPAPEDWVNGMPPLTAPPPIPDVPADSPSVTPDGTALPDTTNYGYAPPPDALPPGMNFGNATGVFAVGGPFSTAGVGPKFSSAPGYSFAPGSSVTIAGQPGAYYTTPSGQTYSTAIGMFGLGGMNAAGGAGFSLGGANKESNILGGGADQGFGDLGAISDWFAIKDAKNGVTWDTQYLAKPAKYNASTNWLMSQPTYKAPSGTYGGPSTVGSLPKGKG